MKKYLVLVMFMVSSQLAMAADFTGKVVALKSCAIDGGAAGGITLVKVQAANGTSVTAWTHTSHNSGLSYDTQRTMRQNVFALLLTAYTTDKDVTVQVGSGSGTYCGVAFDSGYLGMATLGSF